MENKDYANLPLKELYPVYLSMDKEKFPEESAKIYEIIQKKEKGELPLSVENNLASLSDRFAASLVDGLIIGVPIIVLMFVYFGFSEMIEMVRKYGILCSIVLILINQVIYLLVNGWLLYKYGQTIGKKIMEIKIVRLDNSVPTLIHSYLIRYLISPLFSLVPFVGSIFGLVDILFIFRSDRRCIHDLMARTRVVNV